MVTFLHLERYKICATTVTKTEENTTKNKSNRKINDGKNTCRSNVY